MNPRVLPRLLWPRRSFLQLAGMALSLPACSVASISLHAGLGGRRAVELIKRIRKVLRQFVAAVPRRDVL
jgi:hypothetical protein